MWLEAKGSRCGGRWDDEVALLPGSFPYLVEDDDGARRRSETLTEECARGERRAGDGGGPGADREDGKIITLCGASGAGFRGGTTGGLDRRRFSTDLAREGRGCFEEVCGRPLEAAGGDAD